MFLISPCRCITLSGCSAIDYPSTKHCRCPGFRSRRLCFDAAQAPASANRPSPPCWPSGSLHRGTIALAVPPAAAGMQNRHACTAWSEYTTSGARCPGFAWSALGPTAMPSRRQVPASHASAIPKRLFPHSDLIPLGLSKGYGCKGDSSEFTILLSPTRRRLVCANSVHPQARPGSLSCQAAPVPPPHA